VYDGCVSAEPPTEPRAAASWPDAPVRARDSVAPGTLLGRYLAVSELGRGAMGVVVRAYDPRLQREVALKLMRTSAMPERSRARMIREARAMAKLSHRNVVAVYDVEIEPQTVTVAMELIEGITLREWLSTKPSHDAVVDVFIAAGEGLAAAHCAGLLHRDFKPGNVLVEQTPSSAETPRVCVTDFGLARASTPSGALSEGGPATGSIEGDDDAATNDALTVAGTVMGTPAYMAPEQHKGGELSPAIDQYAFCIALWEGLVGERPFKGRSTRQLARAKSEGPPKWPIAATPSLVSSAIRRGLAVDGADRFASMDALLDRLRTSRKRSRAGRRTVAAVGVLAALGGGLAMRATGEAPQQCGGAADALAPAWGPDVRGAAQRGVLATEAAIADTVWDRAQSKLDAYASRWQETHRDACEATTVRGAQSERVLDLRMACLSRARIELAAVAQRLADADTNVVAHAHELVDGLPPLSRCADLEALSAAVALPPAEAADAVAAARRQLASARTAKTAGKVREAAAVLGALDADVRATDYAPLRTEWSALFGDVLLLASRTPEAEAPLIEGLRTGLTSGQWDEVVEIVAVLISVYRGLARPTEGLAIAETAWGVLPRTSQPELLEAKLRAAVAGTLRHMARYDEALVEYRRALALRQDILGSGHHLVALSRSQLANALRDRGDHDLARAEYEAALAGLSASLGDTHPSLAGAHISFGNFFARVGDYEQALAHTRTAIEIARNALGPQSHRLGSAYANLGGLLARQGKLEDALVEQHKAAKIWEVELGPDHPDVLMERGNNIAQTLMSLGRFEEAEAAARPALAAMTRAFSPEHPRVAMLQMCLAGILDATDRSAEAEPLLRSVITSREQTLGRDDPRVAAARLNLGKILMSIGRNADAESEVRAGLAALLASVGPDHPHVAIARSTLATIVAAQ